jgi:hypothetical protein
MEVLHITQLMRSFTGEAFPPSSLGAASVTVEVYKAEFIPQQYADLAVELARWPAGACMQSYVHAGV